MSAKRLAFGKHPDGGDLDPDAFAVKAPAGWKSRCDADGAVAGPPGEAVAPRMRARSEGAARIRVPSSAHGRQASGDFRRRRAADPTREQDGEGLRLVRRTVTCAAFPNRYFYVNENRGLAAGFHTWSRGFFRQNDQPLMQKVSDPARRRRDEARPPHGRGLDFVTQSYETLLRGFVWFERSERHILTDKRFDFLREDDPLLVEEALLSKFERIYPWERWASS